MTLSTIILQAADSWKLFQFFNDYNNSASSKWIVGIILIVILRAAIQWLFGISRISRYHRQSAELLAQQNELLQRQIALLERFNGKE